MNTITADFTIICSNVFIISLLVVVLLKKSPLNGGLFNFCSCSVAINLRE